MKRIRGLPGINRFLLGAAAHELQQQATSTPLVIVNVTDIHSDAIIVNPDQIQLLRLPAFSATTLRSWKRQRLQQSRYWKEEQEVSRVLVLDLERMC